MNPDWKFRWKDASHGIPSRRIERLLSEFTLGFYNDALIGDPDNVEILAELGEMYTRSGRLKDGLEIDLKLCRLLPDDPTAHYNLACSLSMLGMTGRAVKALKKAIAKGFKEFSLMARDEDLAALRDEPEFREILDKAGKAVS